MEMGVAQDVQDELVQFTQENTQSGRNIGKRLKLWYTCIRLYKVEVSP